MIILVIPDGSGPGNQMFMYAYAYKAAKQYNKKICIISMIAKKSRRQYVLDKFSLDRDVVCVQKRLDKIPCYILEILIRKVFYFYIKKIKRKNVYLYPPEKSREKVEQVKNTDKNIILSGYFERYGEFDGIKEELKRQFKPNYISDDCVMSEIENMRNVESVALHIRRGDFEKLGRCMKLEYYKEAIGFFRQKYDNVQFYLVTESEKIEEEFCKEEDIKLVSFATKNKYIDEWYVLKNCRHHIVAGSTYSWWAAFSSEKNGIVVKPDEKEYRDTEAVENKMYYNEYFPKEWKNI